MKCERCKGETPLLNEVYVEVINFPLSVYEGYHKLCSKCVKKLETKINNFFLENENGN